MPTNSPATIEQVIERQDELRAILLATFKRHHGSPHHGDAVDEAMEAIEALTRTPPSATIEVTEEMLLDWLAKNPALELTWGELNNDLSDCAWRVHRCHGGINDREWDLIATGETPAQALERARQKDQS
jgi:hypothetical protein